MALGLGAALAAGAERVMAWTDLLDAINVFPVADGDTGHNLALSLAPLLKPPADPRRLPGRLLHAACGNAGNIAAQFLGALVEAPRCEAIAPAVVIGRQRAYAALARPLPGTMLSVLDALEATLGPEPAPLPPLEAVIDRLQAAVAATAEGLPRMRQAGVVDSGALGMLLFLEGYLAALAPQRPALASPRQRFAGRLAIRPGFRAAEPGGYCVEGLVQVAGDPVRAVAQSRGLGESAVTAWHDGRLKVHVHAQDPEALRRALGSMGRLLSFSSAPLACPQPTTADAQVHVMTDAAASLGRREAQRLGLTLLDSYVLLAEEIYPETRLDPQRLYRAMAGGARVGTSQASLAERQQHLARALERSGRLVYLCVGSAYTGIFEAARAWQQANDPEGRLAVIDSGAAAGRLGLAAIATARYAAAGQPFEAVRRFAMATVARCRELLFLARLRFLARSGRLGSGAAIFGDLLHLKPIISPMPQGVQKVGTARSRAEQLRRALDFLADSLQPGVRATVLLEYSDNREWIAQVLRPEVILRHPGAEILMLPLSLTTGVHTGPGTWGLAVLDDPPTDPQVGPSGREGGR